MYREREKNLSFTYIKINIKFMMTFIFVFRFTNSIDAKVHEYYCLLIEIYAQRFLKIFNYSTKYHFIKLC